MHSLNRVIKHFNNPSVITIQESKLRTSSFKIPGYQTFLKNRSGLGGGLLTGVEANLSPVLLSSPENDILVVQTKVEHLNVRIINAYGPQESSVKEEHEKLFKMVTNFFHFAVCY